MSSHSDNKNPPRANSAAQDDAESQNRDEIQGQLQSEEVSAEHSTAENEKTSGSKRLLKAGSITGSMTMVSRVLGLARDVTIARLFGDSDAADAFFLAFKIPNFMRRLFAEGAFNQAFVPVLSEYRTSKTHGEVQELINRVSGSLGGVLLLLTSFGVVATPLIAVPIAYGFTDDPEKFALLVHMLRITFPYLLLISLTALCSAVLNSYDRFAIPAVTPALLNISLIGSAFLLQPYVHTPEVALAWGVLIAGVAQLLFQLPFLARLNLLPKPTIGLFKKDKAERLHEGVQRIKTLMIPALFGVSVSQINLLLDTVIATFLVSGSVTWLYFSDRLVELPLGIFGIAIATVVLPSLSRKHAEKSHEEFTVTLDWALRIVCLIAIPATLALLLLSEQLLIALFHSDNFDSEAIRQSSRSLQAYALGLVAFMAIKIFAPGYFSRQDMKTPVRIGIIAMVANMVLNLLFVFALDLAHVGLALATSVAAFVNAGLLVSGLIRAKVFKLQPGWAIFALRMIFANGVMVLGLLWFTEDWQSWLEWSKWEQGLRIVLLSLGGVMLYGASLFLVGARVRHFAR